MKVVERYILRRAFGVFASALFWTLAMVWVSQILARINLVTDSGQSAFTFFQVATMLLPSVVPIVVPFALIIGITQTLSAMNQDSELVVLSAAGSSRRTIIRPIILMALLASVFVFIVDNGLNPLARERFRLLLASANADLISSVIQEGSFKRVEDGLYVQISERLPDGRLGGIFVADSRDPKTELNYYAKTGVVVEGQGQDNLLLMQDGIISRKAPERPASLIRFDSYGFDLSAFAPSDRAPVMFPKDRPLSYLLNPDPNDAVLIERPDYYSTELNTRFTEWLYPLVFALIAIAAAGDARSHREARLHPMATAIFLALFVRWAGFTVANSAEGSLLFSVLIYLVPLGAAAVAIGFIRANKTLELPVSWVESLSHRFDRLRTMITGARLNNAQPGGRP
ncbi:LPS export ABC transporter permease LptF [Tianweitania sp. BSSL-BM11]|uniref:LPS export ABC transporter permease LptF n=1 Tax=Tianweitania aestuarii TaxID=2814886 RepID=A0ABS5RSH2_9HYPH|nr:LPS export ABC transporter permease LptF [Tianweitania aestuarii]MBS9720000.1 LPS export ABC transporter permease LptF [Tianweitania aestuarii]